MVYVLVGDPAVTKIVTGLLAMFPGDVPVRAQMKGMRRQDVPERVQAEGGTPDELLERIANLVGSDRVRYDRGK